MPQYLKLWAAWSAQAVITVSATIASDERGSASLALTRLPSDLDTYLRASHRDTKDDGHGNTFLLNYMPLHPQASVIIPTDLPLTLLCRMIPTWIHLCQTDREVGEDPVFPKTHLQAHVDFTSLAQVARSEGSMDPISSFENCNTSMRLVGRPCFT